MHVYYNVNSLPTDFIQTILAYISRISKREASISLFKIAYETVYLNWKGSYQSTPYVAMACMSILYLIELVLIS